MKLYIANLIVDKKMIYSKKEKVLIYVLSILCIFNFFIFTILNILVMFGLLNNYLADYTYSLYNPIYDLWGILTIGISILFILTLKGLIKGYKYKYLGRKLFFYITLLILLIYIIIYSPNYIPFRNINVWIITDFFGGMYFLFFLMNIFHRNE
jgi:hypothetical protein